MNFGAFLLILYFIFFLFVLYVFIFGNNKCNRNTCVGSVYRFFTIKVPDTLNAWFRKIFHLKPPSDDAEESCVGKGGPCRYFIIIFFAIMYAALVVDYFVFTYPYLSVIYQYPNLHRFLSFVLPMIPWSIVIALQFIDPGVITADNVEGYLAKYPYDHVIYNEKMCPTDKIPVVPRSRYCGFTHRRVAKYDHYCPWVLASIGEKTHRWFILFLVSCTIASIYYCIGDFLITFLSVAVASRKIRWTTSKSKNLLIYIIITLKLQKFNAACIVLFAVIIITLLVFIAQQLYYISINKTQIELDKYEYEEERRRKNGNKKSVTNFYNKGIIQNWKEFLFPTPVEKSKTPWKPDKFWKKIIKEEEIKAEKAREEMEKKAAKEHLE